MVEELCRQRLGFILEKEGLRPFREALKTVEAFSSSGSVPTEFLQSLATAALQLRNAGRRVTSEALPFHQERDTASVEGQLRTQFGTQLRHGLEQSPDLRNASAFVFDCAVDAVESVQHRRSVRKEPWWDMAIQGNPSRSLLRSTRAWFRISVDGPVLWQSSAEDEDEDEDEDMAQEPIAGHDQDDLLRLSLCQQFFASLHECGLLQNETGVTTSVFRAAVARTRRHVSTVVPGRCETACDGAIRRWQAVVLAPVLALLFCQGSRGMEHHDLEGGSGAMSAPDAVLLRWVARDLQSATSPATETVSAFDEFDVGVPQRLTGDLSARRKQAGSEGSTLWRLSALWIVTLRAERDASLVETHISQLFDIIRDDPESLPAQRDLAAALERYGGQQRLVTRLREDIRRRLMHPGVATKDLLHMFVSCVRVLQRLDPEGVAVEATLVPLQRYLRKRSDALRCIVRSLTTGNEYDGIAAELTRRSGQVVRVDAGSDSDTEQDSEAEGEEGNAQESMGNDMSGVSWDDEDGDMDDSRAASATGKAHPQPSKRPKRQLWRPLARDAPVDHSRIGRADLLTLLVSIYERVDVVAQEYAQLLSLRLLGKPEFDVEYETRVHEMMKLRLGEGPLHTAEVMLKDIMDSKRFRSHVASHRGPVMTLQDSIRRDGTDNAPAQVQSTFARASSQASSSREGHDEWPLPHGKILSYLFWPEIEPPSETEGPWKHLHPAVQARLEAYTKEFATLKRPRTLNWLAQLGTMTLELTAANGTVQELTLSLLEASAALHLGNQGRWTAEELCAVLDAEWADVYRWLRPLLVRVRRPTHPYSPIEMHPPVLDC